MKTYTTEQIRNMVLMGNTKSGKTTLAEAMMMEGKVIDRRGTVEAKNTCILYTSDAADDLICVDLGGRRIIKKKKNTHKH